MKFSHLYEELTLLDICKPVSPEESERRDTEGPAIKIKEALDNAKKTKLPDGTWHVHGNLNISNFNLNSVKNLNVAIVDGYFSCKCNNLTSLEGCPKEVNGSFYCYDNKLTSLEGCPNIVKGGFFCYDNQLTSLEGCPKEVGGNFNCYNNKLTSLKGCPKEINESFYCNNNNLTSLEGCPNKVKRDFSCHTNSKKFTKDEVKSLCRVKGKIYI